MNLKHLCEDRTQSVYEYKIKKKVLFLIVKLPKDFNDVKNKRY